VSNVRFFRELALAVRFLSIDAVYSAQSGHPGMPLGMADIATVLWHKFLKHSPNNPHWFNRDRFVLSNGHGSMLLYALLHLTGYRITIDDLQQFRQLHSKTPGHPEYQETPGVETSTGPLGQGLANAVGMALAEKLLAAEFNRADLTLVDHYTYVFVGDGCLMEGISHEVASLAGTWELGKLIVLYDSNQISIDGDIHGWFTEDVAARFAAYHWQVIDAVDGHDAVAIERAIGEARQDSTRPSLIICNTVIGQGSLLAGSAKVHGASLTAHDIQQLREKSAWPYPPFDIPDAIREEWSAIDAGHALERDWLQCCVAYQARYPLEYHEFLRRINGDLPDEWLPASLAFIERHRQQPSPLATRKASQQCIEYFACQQPELLGGSADLTESNNTDWSGTVAFTPGVPYANYLHYGVREFGMSAIMNGLALHGGFIPYGGTFLVFSDYARNAVRLSALMRLRVIYVYTHDSIGLGEDGPTHQPIEHATMLRVTPNVSVWRPADCFETAVAWQQALLHHQGPSCLLLSRQALPGLAHALTAIEDVQRGGYILSDVPNPQGILIATGSEVSLAVTAAGVLSEQGIDVRVVSMPCAEYFLNTDAAYQEQVLPRALRARLAVEAGSTAYWYRFVGLDGAVLGVDDFGLSAPGPELYQAVGLTVDAIVARMRHLVSRRVE
jgi:transketolase